MEEYVLYCAGKIVFLDLNFFDCLNLQETFSDYSLFMVGSTISGFGTDVSDVDMCLVHSAKNGPIYVGNDLRIHSAKILKDFEELLRRNG